MHTEYYYVLANVLNEWQLLVTGMVHGYTYHVLLGHHQSSGYVMYWLYTMSIYLHIVT